MPALTRHLARNLVLLGLGTGLMSCDGCVGDPVEPASEPSFTMTLRPDALRLNAGASGSSSIEIHRDEFFDVITIRVEAPHGIVATPSATSLPYRELADITVNVSVPGSTRPALYPVPVIASAKGLADRRDTLLVEVDEPSRGGFTLSVSPTAMAMLPLHGDTAVVSIVREPPFTDRVNLSVTTAPSEVYTSFIPRDWIREDSLLTRLYVRAGEHAEPGTRTLTITGSSPLVPSQSAALTLTVLPLPYAFSLSVIPDTLAVPQGRRGTVSVKVSRLAGFDSGIALSTAGDVYPGIGTSFTPGTIPAGASTANLDVDVPYYVATGTYPIPVRGAATGVAASADTLTLIVTPALECFTLAVVHDTLVVRPGRSDSTNVLLTRALGFSGDVALSVTGAPAGVSAAFAPVTDFSGYYRKLLVNVGLATAPGTYPLTVRGTSTGCTEGTATVVLVVPAVGGITISTTSDVPLKQGGTALVPLGIGRIPPFDGEVTLTAEGLPTGVTAVFAPATLARDETTARVTYTAVASVPVGTYPVTIRATGFGVPSTTMIQYLLISPP